jgi:putative ABC transport system permease protein
MSRRRHDRWLLIRLAAQNVGRRRLRAILLGVAVMLGVGIGFASFVAGWALRDGMARSFSRMGADLLVVPRATLVNITASLLTVQPTDETLPADLAQRIAGIAGVAQVAPQRIVPALVEGRNVNLIAFDPAQDFSVQSWVEARQAGPFEGLIAGAALSARLGETLSVCGMPMRVSARLGKTGVGPFDESYFLSFAALADIVRSAARRMRVPPPSRRRRRSTTRPRSTGCAMATPMCARETCRPIGFRPSCCSFRPAPRWRTSSSALPSLPTPKSSRATAC